jgi:hypothetical protein
MRETEARCFATLFLQNTYVTPGALHNPSLTFANSRSRDKIRCEVASQAVQIQKSVTQPRIELFRKESLIMQPRKQGQQFRRREYRGGKTERPAGLVHFKADSCAPLATRLSKIGLEKVRGLWESLP